MIRRRVATAVLVTGALALVAACGSLTPSTAPVPSGAPFRGVADAEWRHPSMAEGSVRLAASMVALGAGQDVVVSPTSLQLLMAVLREGATGAMETQLEEELGLPEGGSQVIADLRAVLGEYDGDVAGITAEQAPETPLLHIAEGVFLEPDGVVHQDFLNRVGAYHEADVVETRFASGAAKAAMDAFVAEQTGGLLTQAPAEIPEGTRLALLDTVVFGASWRSPFPADGTADRPFTLADGTQVPARTMAQNLATAYVAGEGWQALELPYTDGFVMRLALADNGRAPDWSAVAEALAGAPETAVHVELPSWRTDTTLDLLPLLQSVGVRAVARPGHLDGIYDGAVVSQVVQGASISVAEGGTVAAAATQAGADGAAPQEPAATMLFNRPFEYQVVHEATGMVLFAGRLVDPR